MTPKEAVELTVPKKDTPISQLAKISLGIERINLSQSMRSNVDKKINQKD